MTPATLLGTPAYPTTGPLAATYPDGSPRHLDPTTGLPLMTQREASWHSHYSGMAARTAADAAGSDPRALSSVLGAAATVTTAPRVGDMQLRPLTLGTLAALQKLGSVYTLENPTGTPLAVNAQDIAVAAVIFATPEWAYSMMEAGKIEEVRAAALQLSFSMTAPVLRQVNAFIAREMEEFFGPEAAEKKPVSDPRPAPDPEMPSMPSPAAGSPDAVGS